MQTIATSLAALSLALAPWARLSAAPPLQTGSGGDGQVHITQVDTSHFPQITVYVSVTDANGEPLGVDPSQIALSENGSPVTPRTVGGQGEIGPLTTLLVMDVSGSMNEAGKLATAKTAAQAYVKQMRPGDQAGLVTFNTQVEYVQPVTADRAALTRAIDGLKARSDTTMYDALAQAVKILENVPGRKAIIALTDGLDNRSTVKSGAVIEQIGPGGLTISTIGLGDPSQLGITNAGLDEKALKTLAEKSGGSFGYANDPESLRSLYERFGRALQSEYVFTYLAPSALRDGVTRSLSVSLANAGAALPAAAQPSAAAAYNPGGLVPEVAQASWPLFGVVLAGLLALLALPMLVGRGGAMVRALAGRRSKKSRIRLAEPSEPRIRMR